MLSERALELHESEKAQRKKKGTKSIVDLSKCFNVSQQVQKMGMEVFQGESYGLVGHDFVFSYSHE